jgi:hypothetical protein
VSCPVAIFSPVYYHTMDLYFLLLCHGAGQAHVNVFSTASDSPDSLCIAGTNTPAQGSSKSKRLSMCAACLSRGAGFLQHRFTGPLVLAWKARRRRVPASHRRSEWYSTGWNQDLPNADGPLTPGIVGTGRLSHKSPSDF